MGEDTASPKRNSILNTPTDIEPLITQSTAIGTTILRITTVSRIINALQPLRTAEPGEATAQLILDTDAIPITRRPTRSRCRNANLVISARKMLVTTATTTDRVRRLRGWSRGNRQAGTVAVLVFWLRAPALLEALLLSRVFAVAGLGPGHGTVDRVAGALSGWSWSRLHGFRGRGLQGLCGDRRIDWARSDLRSVVGTLLSAHRLCVVQAFTKRTCRLPRTLNLRALALLYRSRQSKQRNQEEKALHND